MSACSMTPRFTPCNSSPDPGSVRSIRKSTMSETIVSAWPEPTVSTKIVSYPAASHSMMLWRVPPPIPPERRLPGAGRTKAFGCVARRVMRVLSPRILPPVRSLAGS